MNVERSAIVSKECRRISNRDGEGGACQQQKNGMSDGSFAAVKCANKAVKRRRSEASLASPLN